MPQFYKYLIQEITLAKAALINYLEKKLHHTSIGQALAPYPTCFRYFTSRLQTIVFKMISLFYI